MSEDQYWLVNEMLFPEGPNPIGNYKPSSATERNQDKIISLLEAIYAELESINNNLR